MSYPSMAMLDALIPHDAETAPSLFPEPGDPVTESGPPVLSYRAIWISDIHLGTRGCQAEKLLDFLKHTQSEYLYLVGDIFDGWQLRKRWYWPQTHNDVVQKIMRRARKGARFSSFRVIMMKWRAISAATISAASILPTVSYIRRPKVRNC